jgi:acetyl esterase/lipase
VRWLSSLLFVTLLSACSATTILNATAPRQMVTRTTGLLYAPDLPNRLDIYEPAQRCPDAPVVVFFFGGGWQNGTRSMYRFVGSALASRGVVTVIPDYRLYPQVRFPTFMHDAAKAVKWTVANIGQYGGDPRHIFLMGHSAGAQIATLLALNTSYLQTSDTDPHVVAGVIGLSGPYDFLPLTDPSLKAIFGAPDTWRLSQPVNFVSTSSPPMLLASGTADQTVLPRNTASLAEKLRQDGVTVEERYYAGVGHEVTIGAFASLLSFLAPSRRQVLDFIAAHHALCAMPRSS